MRSGLIKMVDANGKVTVESFAARQKRFSQAFQRYARRHGFSADTVRSCTSLRNAALVESGIS